MPLLLFSELVAVVLLVSCCSREGDASVSVGDISEEVKSFGDLERTKVLFEALEAFLDLGVGMAELVRMVELVAEVCPLLSVHFGVVVLE